MTTVTYILKDGGSRDLVLSDGQSVMQAAILANIDGIDGECGGCCSCATCHVYVEAVSGAAPPPPDEMETELLDGVSAERRETSRLGCQLVAAPGLAALVVRIPESQI